MGGRGSTSSFSSQQQPTLKKPIRNPKLHKPPQMNPIAQQVPDDSNTPVQPNALTNLSQMSDAQLAQAFTDSQNAGLPNHLDDAADITQRFVFHAGLNDKPQVLDTAAFNQFMQNNNISQSQIISRSINGGTLKTTSGGSRNLTPQDVSDMMMYSRLNYVGGKLGGQAYGAGTYFDMNGGRNTGYASGKTVTAVLNPATAKIITDRQLQQKATAFDKSHPQFAKATGGYSSSFYNNNMSVYALAMGYNVIKDATGSYHNVIDRKALVYRK
ncbi:MAG: hypothetical protein PHS82_02945 [Lachnospiraceae bacterium]|nr:hypothetical protein [Lachnospiraceae bacterium]